MRRVVVTGMGIVSSIGNDCADTSASLRAGKSGVTAAPEYAQMGFRSQVFARPQIVVKDHLTKRDLRFMGDGAAWNYIAALEAIKQSGLEESEISNERTGLIVGSGGPSTRAIVEAADIARNHSIKKIGPFAVPKAMSSTSSANLSVLLKIKGYSYSMSSACSTSSHCIGTAMQVIQLGQQDVVIAGGSEELEWSLSSLFDAMGAMSSAYNDTPDVSSRAFDKNRDGFVIAGGAGVVILEEFEHAKARGANIIAELVGYGASSDGYSMVQPNGEGAARCMRMAIGSGAAPIDYLNPHATSTPIGDEKEAEAVRDVFGERIPLISATKSLTGHSLGAAGAQEAIYSLLMMQGEFVAASAHIEELDPIFEDLPIVRERKENVQLGTILSNSFGFGGTNASLMFRHPDVT